MTEKHARLAKCLLAAGVFAALWFSLGHLTETQRVVAAIFGCTVTLWATEALPTAVTALLSTCLLILFAGIEYKVAFGAYGNYIIHLFIGSFIIAKGIETTGLNKRIAWNILKRPWATKSPATLMLTMGAIVLLISSFVSNTATTAMMLPIIMTLLVALKVDQGDKPYAAGAMLMLTWSASVAVGTPVSTPPNMIGIGLAEEATGTRVGFGQWMLFAMPVSLAMLLVAWLIVTIFFRKGSPDVSAGHAAALDEASRLGPLRPGERNVLIAFAVAVLLWLAPDVVPLVAGKESALGEFAGRINSAVAALVAAALLFLLPDKDTEQGVTMTWKQARTIDWGTILLFGGGLALGDAMFKSGLAKAFGEWAVLTTGANSVWTISFVMIVAAILISELASNTASATTMVPVAIGLAQGAGVDPTIPAIATTVASSLGFMLPISTAPNAIVYGSGLLPAKAMMRAGILIDIAGALIVFGVLRVTLPALGFGG